jgi:serine/threonine-protein kinase
MIGKYRVEAVIGEGGMGVVLKAHHSELGEDVAIKCLLPEMLDRPEVVARFLREARAAAKLKGEHVARVFDVGKLPDSQTPYIVMEYLDGADLNAIIKQHGRQHPAVAVDLLLQACEALAEAHSIGIVHRDIKGSNFLVTQAPDEPPILKVLDFGIATAPDGDSNLTNASSVLGTPAYMAPEQISATRSADVRSDIWALGIVLYELIEGKRPFRSDVYYDLCLMIRTEPPPPLTNPELPDGLEAVVHKCLEKSPDARYQTCAELAFDLLPFASDPSIARATAEQCARLARRSGRGERVEGDNTGGHARLSAPMPSVGAPTTPSRGAEKSGPTPAPKTPGPKTPVPKVPLPPIVAAHAPAKAAADLDAAETLVADKHVAPAPVPEKRATPTSISASSGQMSPSAPLPSLRRKHTGVVVVAIVVLAVVGLGVYTMSGGDSADHAAAPAPPPPVPTPAVAPPSGPEVTPPAPPPAPPLAPTIPEQKPPAEKPVKPDKPPVEKPVKPDKPEKPEKPPVKPPKKPKPDKPTCQPPGQVNPFDDRPVCS